MTHLDHNTFQNSSVQEIYYAIIPDTFFSHVILHYLYLNNSSYFASL